MRITFDKAKRAKVLKARGLDFNDAGEAFIGFYLTRPDYEHSDDEDRNITLGVINSTVVIIVWTERDGERRIITMWKANEKERANYERARRASG